MKRGSIFETDGIPRMSEALPLAMQHVVAMIVGCVTPAIIVSGAVPGGLSREDQVILIQSALVIAALSTLLQLFPIGGKAKFAIGSGLPIIMGVSFAYVPSMQAIAASGGTAIPTVKPWNLETIQEKLGYCRESGCFAVAMDIDAAGLPFLKNMNPPAGSKTVEQLAEIAGMVGKPFIVKGVMTVSGALKAKEAGASAIVVSNHGGRVLDQCAATAEVLADIVDAMKGSGVKIFVDGGIRSGVDVFKALALGADAVLICRPFVPMVYGGAEEGVKLYIEKIGAELSDTMAMCGAENLASINRDMVLVK